MSTTPPISSYDSIYVYMKEEKDTSSFYEVVYNVQ